MRSASAYGAISEGLERSASLSAAPALPPPPCGCAPAASPWRAMAASASALISAAGGAAGDELPELDEEEALALATPGAAVAAVAADGAADLTQRMQQLRKEPAESEEVEAKFAIFESYMGTVTKLRDDLHATWTTTKPQFEGTGAAAAMERRLQDIDRTGNLGVDEGASAADWLVLHMAKQACRNHAQLSAVLRDMEIKLSVLAAEADCPMCLEPLGNEADGKQPAKVLSCCHKTCTG